MEKPPQGGEQKTTDRSQIFHIINNVLQQSSLYSQLEAYNNIYIETINLDKYDIERLINLTKKWHLIAYYNPIVDNSKRNLHHIV